MPFEDVCQNANAIKKVLIFGNSDKQIDYLIFGRFLYGTYTSLTFQNIPADGHIQTSTPTVRGHAEACPSTTYGKYLHRRLHIPLGGREFFFHSILCQLGEGPLVAGVRIYILLYSGLHFNDLEI